MELNPLAGTLATPSVLVDVSKLITSYYSETPDFAIPEQRVCFGTSGHRGSPFKFSFNEWHILAIAQATCEYRSGQGINGPLFIGLDTHALSVPASVTALEVLAANGVEVMLSENDEYTPTPSVSLAILKYNEGRKSGLADGIVITPSHNPPEEGGIKYNPPNGGPAEPEITNWIQNRANEFLKKGVGGIRRIPYSKALDAPTTHRFNFLENYVADLVNVIDMQAIHSANISMGVDPLGGAGVHYWKHIADRYGLNLNVVSEEVDPTFRFMTLDWDGKIRMDPSSVHAMKRLIHLKDKYQIAFSCDTDHDRHGIVTKSAGLMSPNNFLSVAVHYLFSNRAQWNSEAAVGKTLVSSAMIDRVAAGLGRKLYEVPVGFKWFVDGLFSGFLGFGGEESAGASFLRLNGKVWTTDKDGIIMALLAGEITAKMGRDPGEIYQELTKKYGKPFYDRFEAHATRAQKEILKNLSPENVHRSDLAGEKIRAIYTKAPGNGAPIGGIKVVAENGWFAARPSGTEDIYKIYVESFLGEEHLKRIFHEAQDIVTDALKTLEAING